MEIKNFFQFLQTLNITSKTQANKQDLSEKTLMEKKERVNTKWNKFKSIFGYGEQLTGTEASLIKNIEIEKRIKINKSQEIFNPNESVFKR